MNRTNYQKKPSKPPFNFDLKKYKDVSKLDEKDWFLQLWYRRWIQLNIEGHPLAIEDLIKNIKDNGVIKYEYSDVPHVSLFSKQQKKSPICFLTRKEAYQFQSILKLDAKEKGLHEDSERERSLSETIEKSFLQGIGCFDSEDVERFCQEPFDFFIKYIKADASHPYNSVFYGDRIHLTVDLSASDEQIKRALTERLKEARKTLHPSKSSKQRKCLGKIQKNRIDNKIFRKFVGYYVLPYWDLKLLARFYKIKLTEARIIALLELTNDRSAIDDKIKPFVEYVMTDEFAARLNYQFSK